MPVPPRLLALALAALCAATCRSARTPGELWSQDGGAVSDPSLARLCADLWEEQLRWDPISAGRLGDARFLGLLPDRSLEARAERRRRLADLSARAEVLEDSSLGDDDRVTLAMARRSLRDDTLLADADTGRWVVDPRRGPQVSLFGLALDQPAATADHRAALLMRWSAMGAYVDQGTDDLRRGLREGLVANRHAVTSTLEQLDRLLAQDVGAWPLARPAGAEHLSGPERLAFHGEIERHLEQGLRPALVRRRELLAGRVLAAARSDDQPGLTSLPGGRALYADLIEVHLGLPLQPEELHEFGRAEVERVRGEMRTLGARLFGTDDLSAIQRRLREDPALHFTTREQVETAARDALARAEAAIPRWFGRMPRAPCIVVPIPDHEAPETTIAYYREPAVDGSLPGRYFINSWAPETRPRYEAEVLAYHEAIPGHHLQIAIAQELEGLPAFRRHLGPTAFVEGWALYTERLCDEMGLYSGDLDRMGVLSFDAWRACRLVVDTGLHAFGWSRDQAIDYLQANTLLAPNNVVNEVDRYITTPAQALAYKVGQREMLRLRDMARAALDDRFDIRAFHDVVLENGAVTLDILGERVAAWAEGGTR